MASSRTRARWLVWFGALLLLAGNLAGAGWLASLHARAKRPALVLRTTPAPTLIAGSVLAVPCRVENATGEPVAKAQVTVRLTSGEPATAVTDAGGWALPRLAVEQPPRTEGWLAITARAGEQRADWGWPVVVERPLAATIEAGGSWFDGTRPIVADIRITERATGLPAAGEAVRIELRDPADRPLVGRDATTDKFGMTAFTIPRPADVSADAYRLVVLHPAGERLAERLLRYGAPPGPEPAAISGRYRVQAVAEPGEPRPVSLLITLPDGSPAAIDFAVRAGGRTVAEGRTDQAGLGTATLPATAEALDIVVGGDPPQPLELPPDAGRELVLLPARRTYEAGEVCELSAAVRSGGAVVFELSRAGQPFAAAVALPASGVATARVRIPADREGPIWCRAWQAEGAFDRRLLLVRQPDRLQVELLAETGGLELGGALPVVAGALDADRRPVPARLRLRLRSAAGEAERRTWLEAAFGVETRLQREALRASLRTLAAGPLTAADERRLAELYLTAITPPAPERWEVGDSRAFHAAAVSQRRDELVEWLLPLAVLELTLLLPLLSLAYARRHPPRVRAVPAAGLGLLVLVALLAVGWPHSVVVAAVLATQVVLLVFGPRLMGSEAVGVGALVVVIAGVLAVSEGVAQPTHRVTLGLGAVFAGAGVAVMLALIANGGRRRLAVGLGLLIAGLGVGVGLILGDLRQAKVVPPAPPERPVPVVRELAPGEDGPGPRAVWPVGLTGDRGSRTFEVAAPESRGDYAFEAVGWGVDGERAMSRQPFQLRPPLRVELKGPAVVRAGDTVRLPVVVHNATNQRLTAQLAARAGGDTLTVTPPPPLEVPPAGAATGMLELRARRPGSGTVTVEATAGERRAEVRREITVEPAGRMVWRVANGQLVNPAEVSLKPSEGGAAEARRWEVIVYPRPEAEVAAARESLDRWPWDDVPGAAARLRLDARRRRLETDAVRAGRLDATLLREALVLLDQRRPDGSIGPGPMETALAVQALHHRTEAIDLLPAAELAAERLEASATEANDPLATAAVVEVLAELDPNDDGVQTAADTLIAQLEPEQPPAVAVAIAAALVATRPGTPTTSTAAARLEELAKRGPDGVWWPAGTPTAGGLTGVQADRLTTATAVQVLSLTQLAPELVTEGLRWLRTQRQADGGWGHPTVSAAVAFTLVRADTAPGAAGRVMVTVGDQEPVALGWSEETTDRPAVLALPRPANGVYHLRLDADRLRAPHYQVRLGDVLPWRDRPAGDLAVSLLWPATEVGVGQRVEARVRVESTAGEAMPVSVSWPLPSGWRLDPAPLNRDPAVRRWVVRDGTLHLDLGDLAAGTGVEIPIRGRGDWAGELEVPGVAATRRDTGAVATAGGARVTVTAAK